MRHPGYHGGFEHPVRSFVIGTTLLVLLFFGFVAGIELGSPPAGSATTTRLVEGTGQTVLVPTTETKTISVPSSAQVKWRVIDGEKYVIIHQPGKKQVVYKVKYLPSEITSDGTSAAAAAAVRLVTVEVPTVTTEPSLRRSRSRHRHRDRDGHRDGHGAGHDRHTGPARLLTGQAR